MKPHIPTSVYRLQFNSTYTFVNAVDLIDYLQELGINDCYTSPLMKAMPGSQHSYDVTDHTQLNPEIGTEEEFGSFAEKLRSQDMGLIVDIIPNHMCISVPYNPWWNDVLENGPSSPYANFFNIDWDPPRRELSNKVLLPFLDQQFGRVIENKELQVLYENGCFYVQYYEARYPTNPKSWNHILEPAVKELEKHLNDNDPDFFELQSIITALDHLPDITETAPHKVRERMREKEIIKNRLASLLNRNKTIKTCIDNTLKRLNGTKQAPHTFDHLEGFLKEQSYRLSHWRVAHDEINYRRFFDISELAGIRAENPKLFVALHDIVMKMISRGWVTGLRIDHVDGLFHPNHYLRELQHACLKALRGEQLDVSLSETSPWFYVIVEKILSGNERLRNHWPVHGTTGYDFLNLLNGLFVDKNSEEQFIENYSNFTDLSFDISQLLYTSKRFILNVSMSSELFVLARHLDRISEQHRYSRDFTLQSLRTALRSVMASLSVYRSYICADEKRIDNEDRHFIVEAIQKAKHLNPALSASVFDFIENVLLLKEPPGLDDAQREERNNFVMRFQQLTGPVMAKGLEDTVFYRFYPLASLNEVGAEIGHFGISIEEFHKNNLYRQQHWPHSFLSSSTHDTKRSEDVRARINVLSEIPEEWNNAIHRWEQMNRDKKKTLDNGECFPDRNEEYLLYQTLVGSWPLEPLNEKTHTEYVARIDQYMNKAMKEAKIHTSWINPNEKHDKSVQEFIHAILDRNHPNSFLKDLEQFLAKVKYAGMYNSLSQTLLKIISPGIPDFYQGSELWNFTLVDPDNRRPVNYGLRKQLLKEMSVELQSNRNTYIDTLISHPEDGKIKLFIIKEALALRRQHKDLFSQGDYIALQTKGERKEHVIAFSRALNGDGTVTLAGRFYSKLSAPTAVPLGHTAWKDTVVEGLTPGRYQDVFTHQEFESNGTLSLAKVFHHLPIALLKIVT